LLGGSILDRIVEDAKQLKTKPIFIKTKEPPPTLYWPRCHAEIWIEQERAINEVLSRFRNDYRIVILSAPTGAGKEAVHVTIARYYGGQIIKLNKRLQQELWKYEVPPIFGRNEYDCAILCEVYGEGKADKAPCLLKKKDGIPCPIKQELQEEERCNGDHSSCILYFGSCLCKQCEWSGANRFIDGVLDGGGIITSNHGNFWKWRQKSTFNGFDEAEKIFGAGMQRIKLSTSVEVENSEEGIRKALTKEIDHVREEISKVKEMVGKIDVRKAAELVYKLELKLERLYDFYTNVDICFAYKNYVEILPTEMAVRVKRIVGNAYCLLVSATPVGPFPQVRYEVPHRHAVYRFYTSNLSVTRPNHTEAMEKASNDLINVCSRFIEEELTEKIVVECVSYSNIEYLSKKLSSHFLVSSQVRNRYRQSIEEFIASNADIFLGAGISRGIDFSQQEIALAVLFKVPYPTLDERIKAIIERAGREYYDLVALREAIQFCGRVAREQKFAVSLILDLAFERLYQRYYDWVPLWFRERFRSI